MVTKGSSISWHVREQKAPHELRHLKQPIKIVLLTGSFGPGTTTRSQRADSGVLALLPGICCSS